MDDFDKLCAQVSKRIVPSSAEREKIENLAESIRSRVDATRLSLGLEAEVRIDGSVAKDTWLSQEADVDIFMRVPPELTREDFERRSLEVAKAAMKGFRTVERFAEHPYVEAWVDAVRVNIVPCYGVEKGKWQSATDRTPYHTEYMKIHLDKRLRHEVRLLKKLTKAAEIYGAEIKTSGFSGFLCEVLTLYSDSFRKLIELAASWKRRQVIDIEKAYTGRETEVYDLFDEPLIVIDPIDPARNVAAAVAEKRLWEFVALSRALIKDPRIEFFYPPEGKVPTPRALQNRVEKLESSIVFLTFGEVNAVVDILWSQLYKTEKSLKNILEEKGFTVYRSAAWSNEKNLNLLIFELERSRISKARTHLGPQVERREESEKFLKRHLGASDTMIGPWIERERWKVRKTRDYVDALSFLRQHLRNGGRDIGVGSRVAETLRKGYRLTRETDISRLASRDENLAKFLSKFLTGTPTWLRCAKYA
jgi:tRNA nucleotidyltransferase (CCA-adding enzyme)